MLSYSRDSLNYKNDGETFAALHRRVPFHPIVKTISHFLYTILVLTFASSAFAGQIVRSSGGGDEISLLNGDLGRIGSDIAMSLHADDPCKCDLKLALEKMGRLIKMESDIEKLMGSHAKAVTRQWNSVLQQAAQNAQAIEPGSTASVAMKGVFNALVAYGTQSFHAHLGPDGDGLISSAAQNAMDSTVGGIPGALQKVVDAKTAKRMENNIPALAGLDDAMSDYARWLRLQKSAGKLKDKLWDALLDSPCIKALGERCGGTGECSISGLDEKTGKKFKTSASLAHMRSLATDISGKARAETFGDCCNLCKILNALKTLDDMKAIARNRVKEVGDGAKRALETQISLNQDLFKWLSRKGALSGNGYQALSATMGFIPTPFAGVTLAAMEGLVGVLDSMVTKEAADSLKENIKSVSKNLKELNGILKDWKRFNDDLSKKQLELIKNALKRCDFKIPCDDPVGLVTDDPIATEPEVIVDSGEWCSYWPWGDNPEDVFIPEGDDPGDMFTPDPEGGGFTPDGEKDKPRTPDEQDGGGIPPPVESGAPLEPITFVKAKQTVIENGKRVSKAVAGAQIKLSFLAPALPLAGNKRSDEGFDKDPLQGVTDKNGHVTLDSNKKVSHAAPFLGAQLFEAISGIREAIATPATGRSVEVNVPSGKSYIIRIKPDKKREDWKRPSSYLSAQAARYVVRSWLAGDILYVVVAVPDYAEVSQ
ncbi:MAG: hypothetical protein R8M38_09760 [Mariprofundaceae bacterium]